MGLFHVYPNGPTFDSLLGSNCIDAPTLIQPSFPSPNLLNIVAPSTITCKNLFLAFSSPTTGLLTCWHFSGSNVKTKEETNHLWQYIQDPMFNPSEEATSSLDRECSHIKKYLQDDSNLFQVQHGWICTSFDLPLVKKGVKFASKTDPSIPSIHIENLIHHSITDIIKSVFADSVLSMFHLSPFEQFWTTVDGCNVHVHSEVYTSPCMLQAHKEINQLPQEPGNNHD